MREPWAITTSTVTMREPWAITTSIVTMREPWASTTSTVTMRESWGDYYLNRMMKESWMSSTESSSGKYLGIDLTEPEKAFDWIGIRKIFRSRFD